MNYRSILWDDEQRSAVADIHARASFECETEEEFAQAAADRDTLLAILGVPV